MADAPDLGSGGAILRGSSPLPGTSFLLRRENAVAFGEVGGAAKMGDAQVLAPMALGKIARGGERFGFRFVRLIGGQDAAVEGFGRSETEDVQNGGSEIDVAAGHLADIALLEIRTAGHQRVIHIILA